MKKKTEKTEKTEKHPLFLFFLTYYHLAFDDLCIFVKNEI